MFVLAKSKNYFWPVVIELPANGGRYEKYSFELEFKPMSASRIKEVLAKAESGELTDSLIIPEIVVGWKGINDEDGQSVPFSKSSLDELIEIPTVGQKIVHAYFASVQGAPRKN